MQRGARITWEKEFTATKFPIFSSLTRRLFWVFLTQSKFVYARLNLGDEDWFKLLALPSPRCLLIFKLTGVTLKLPRHLEWKLLNPE